MGSRECFAAVVSKALELACDTPKHTGSLVPPQSHPLAVLLSPFHQSWHTRDICGWEVTAFLVWRADQADRTAEQRRDADKQGD
eukprot:289103-Rhodomonas_salina.1